MAPSLSSPASDPDLRLLLDATDEGVYSIDTNGCCTFINASALAMLEYPEPEAILGRNMHEVIHHHHADGTPYPTAECPIFRAYREGEIVRVADEVFWRRDGSSFPVRYASSPIRQEGVIHGAVVTFVDITEHKRAETRLAAEHVITRSLVEAASFDEAAPTILNTLRTSLEAQIGELWFPDPERGVLRCTVTSRDRALDPLEAFVKENVEITFTRGVGLPGRVWATHEPAWIADLGDDPNFPRAASAVRVGLRSGFAFPIHSPNDFFGVMAFYTSRRREPDTGLLNMMASIGGEVGQFILRKRAERALRETETLKGSILEAALDCIITIDQEGRVLEFNPAAEQTFGYLREEVLGKPMAEFIIPERLREAHTRGIEHYLKTGEGPVLGKRIELPALRADGTEFPAELAILPVWLDGRELFTAYLHDITDQKRAEEAQSERVRLSAVRAESSALLATNDPFQDVLQRCTQMVVQHLDMAFARIWTLNEATQMLELQASAGLYTHLDGAHSRVRVGEFKIGRIAQQAQPHLTNSVQTDPNISDPDWAEREGMVAFAGYPLTVEGQVVGVLAMFARHTISDATINDLAPLADSIAQYIIRKRVEAGLREAEERYRFLADTIPQQVWSATPDGRLDYVNQVVLDYFGCSFDEVIGDGWVDRLHPDEVEVCIRRWLHSLETGDPYEFEFRLRRADGLYRWHLARALPRFDAAGRIIAWFGTNTDIQDRRTTEEALAQAKEAAEAASKAKSQFLANMSHELRTPLNAVIGYSELLQEEAEEAGLGGFLPELKKIHGSGKQLLSLVNDVLDLSKIEAGKMDIRLEHFDLADVVREAADSVAHRMEQNNNRFIVHCAPGVGPMTADPTKVRQCILNLLSNAAKFTQDGEVRFDVDRLDDTYRLRVADTGIGMSAEQLDRLFEQFYRGQHDGAQTSEGTGLGLAITQRLCEMMGGRINVESEPGVGSTFTILLPIRVRLMPGSEASPPPAAGPHPARVSDAHAPNAHALQADAPDTPDTVPTVLVIDDDPDARDLIERALRRQGFRVVSAPDGPSGLRLAREIRPDAITADVLMPDMDGWQVLSALKSDPDLADTPVIMVTMVEDEHRAFTLGAAEYLTKPVEHTRLAEVLQRLCPVRAPGNACRVLLVEDDADTRELVRRTLGSDGYAVDEARNGREALARLVEAQPEIILLDLMMPEMDGFEFVEELRKHRDWRRIPVVVITARDLSADDRRRLNGCVETILRKGDYSRDDLLHEICSRIAGRAARLTGNASRPDDG